MDKKIIPIDPIDTLAAYALEEIGVENPFDEKVDVELWKQKGSPDPCNLGVNTETWELIDIGTGVVVKKLADWEIDKVKSHYIDKSEGLRRMPEQPHNPNSPTQKVTITGYDQNGNEIVETEDG